MPPKLDNSQRVYMDTESQAMIFEGCSVNQLALLFDLRVEDVKKRLAGAKPNTMTGRQGNPTYLVKDVAHLLTNMQVTAEMIDKFMEKATPKSLPPIVNKFYWSAQIDRVKYQEMMNELWFTDDVMETLSGACQALRIGLLLLPDTLMSEAGLTDAQFQAAQDVIDGMIEQLNASLVAEVTKPSRRSTEPEAWEV